MTCIFTQTISDGCVHPDRIQEIALERNDYVTVTDHDSPEYHYREDSICSFTGDELTAKITIDGQERMIHLLLYGFHRQDFDFLVNLGRESWYSMSSIPALPKLMEKIKPLRDSGALLSLAHPYAYFTDVTKILSYCGPYVDMIEALHITATESEAKYLLEWCVNNNKLASGGSDYHELEYTGTPYMHLVKRYPKLFAWIPMMARS